MIKPITIQESWIKEVSKLKSVGDPTSTRDYDISLYISEYKPHLFEPVLWSWVRLKTNSLTKSVLF